MSRNRELTTLRHCIQRIHDEINENLLELRGVAINCRQVTREITTQGDVVTHQGLNQAKHVSEKVIHTHGAQLQALVAAELDESSDYF